MQTEYQTRAVAWIGVGKMGLPIAARMVQAGIHVTAFDPRPDRTKMAVEQGIRAASSVAEAIDKHDVVFTSLPDDAALRTVVLGSAPGCSIGSLPAPS